MVGTKTKPSKYSSINWAVSVVGNKFIVEGFKKFINENEFHKAGRIAKHYNIYCVSWGGVRTSRKIIEAIEYTDSNICLTRKLERVKLLFNIELAPRIFENVSVDDLYKLYAQYGNWKNVYLAKKWSPNGLQKHLRKVGIPIGYNGEYNGKYE